MKRIADRRIQLVGIVIIKTNKHRGSSGAVFA